MNQDPNISHLLPIPNWDWDTFAFWEGALSVEQCNEVISYAIGDPEPAQCNYGFNPHLRSANVWWLKTTDEKYSWLYDRLLHLAAILNERHFHFNIQGACEAIQLTRFNEGDHFSARHMDRMPGDYNGSNLPRKFTLAIPLSERSEFGGGDFEFDVGGNEMIVPAQERGTLLTFPSFVLHRVTPVTSGVRWSLVLWLGGPSFK